MGMHQPMDSYPDDMARNIGAGWDANGSPIVGPEGEVAYPSPSSLARVCWICGQRTPRTAGGYWLEALVTLMSGGMTVRWSCSAVCHQMTLSLLFGIVRLLGV